MRSIVQPSSIDAAELIQALQPVKRMRENHLGGTLNPVLAHRAGLVPCKYGCRASAKVRHSGGRECGVATDQIRPKQRAPM